MVTVNQSEYGGANISYVIDSSLEVSAYGYTEEPVSLALAKQYCRVLTGDLEDDLILMFITSAREAIEKVTGLSLIPKSAEVMMICPQPEFEIPFGPVTSDVSFVDLDQTGSNQAVIGFDFPKTKYPYNIVTTATYTCGYDAYTIPVQLKNCILTQVNWYYENRGDNSDMGTLCTASRKMAQQYSRIPWFN